MKVFISADIEGATGITSYKQVVAGRKEFEKARLFWIEDLNKLTEGAVEAGADVVVINEAHASMDNILADKLHPRAEFVSGYIKPMNQMQGLDDSFNIAFLFNHARAGSMGVLSHSFVMPDVYLLELNGEPIGELGLNALWAGTMGVPIGLIIGDDAAAEEGRDFIPGVKTAVTKKCIDQFTAQCLTPEETGKELKQKAYQVVKKATSFQPVRPKEENTLEITFTMPAMATVVSYVPGVDRVSERTVSFTSRDYQEVQHFRIVATNLAKNIGDQLRQAKS